MSETESPGEEPRTPGSAGSELTAQGLPPGSPRVAPRRRAPRRGNIEIGAIVGTSFRIWFANLAPFLALTALVFAPYVALTFWVGSAVEDPELSAAWGVSEFLIQSLLSYIVTAAVIHGVFRELRGSKAAFGETVSQGISRLPAVLGVALAAGACMVAPFLPAGLLFAFDVQAGAALAMLVAFGFYMVIACGLWVAIPAAVVERPGIVGAIRRSWLLTKGSKLRIFGIMLLFGLLGMLLGAIVVGLTMLATGGSMEWFEIVLSLFVTSLQAVVVAVTYHDLRASKEGLDAEDLAAIFD